MPEDAIDRDALNARIYDLGNVAKGTLLTTPVLTMKQHTLEQIRPWTHNGVAVT
jgi:hypothetical protein